MGITYSELLRLVPDDFRDIAKIEACYSIVYLPLAANAANAVASFTSQDDSYFAATRVIGYATDNAAPPVEQTAPQATFTLKIASNGIMPDNNAVHLASICATATKAGGLEFLQPLWVPPATTVSCSMTDLANLAKNIRLEFWGIRFLTSVKGAMMRAARG